MIPLLVSIPVVIIQLWVVVPWTHGLQHEYESKKGTDTRNTPSSTEHIASAKEIAEELQKLQSTQLPPPTKPPAKHRQPQKFADIPKPEWRILTDWQKVTLKSRLFDRKGQKLLLIAANTEESLNYANEFRDLLNGPEVGALWIGPPSPHGESNSMLPLEVRCRNPIQFKDEPVESVLVDKAKICEVSRHRQ